MENSRVVHVQTSNTRPYAHCLFTRQPSFQSSISISSVVFRVGKSELRLLIWSKCASSVRTSVEWYRDRSDGRRKERIRVCAFQMRPGVFDRVANLKPSRCRLGNHVLSTFRPRAAASLSPSSLTHFYSSTGSLIHNNGNSYSIIRKSGRFGQGVDNTNHKHQLPLGLVDSRLLVEGRR